VSLSIFIFHILFFVFPIFWYYSIKIAKFSNFRLSILTYLNLNIFVFQYIGYFFLFHQLFTDRYESGVNNTDLLLKTFIFNLTCITSLNLSYLFLKYIIFSSSKDKYLLSLNRNVCTYKRFGIGFYVLFFLCLFGSYNYVQNFGFDNLALIKAINGSPIQEVMEARSSMTNNFSGKLHWIKLLNVEIFSLITLVVFGYLVVFKSYKSVFLFVISCTALAFNLLISSEKGLIMDLVIMLIFLYYLLKIHEINVKKIAIIFGAIVLIILLIVYKVFMGLSFDSSLIYAVMSRILGGQIDSAYYYVEYFNVDHSFLYGASFPNPGGFLPFTQFNLTQEIQNWKFPELLEFNVIGSMPTIFWAEAYANFGFLGIVFVSFVVGFVLFFVDFIAIKLSRNIIGLSFYVYLIFHYKNLAVTGISNFMVDINVIVVFIVFIVINKVSLNPPQKKLWIKTPD